MVPVFLLIVFLDVAIKTRSEYIEDRNENVVIIRPDIQHFVLSKDADSFLYDNEVPHRPKRSLSPPIGGGPCQWPLSSGYSEVCCRYTPHHMRCVQTCVWGHRMREGRRRVLDCHEGIWNFVGPRIVLDKCTPYVDCTLQLGPGSRVECWSNFVDHGPICQVTCTKGDSPPLLHKCNIEGVWTPPLPPCVISGAGAGMVVSPSDLQSKENVTTHESPDH